MAVPKRRHSKSRKNKRRSHDAMTTPGYTHCTHCDSPIRAHAVCDKCGYYKDEPVLRIKEKKSKTKTEESK